MPLWVCPLFRGGESTIGDQGKPQDHRCITIRMDHLQRIIVLGLASRSLGVPLLPGDNHLSWTLMNSPRFIECSAPFSSLGGDPHASGAVTGVRALFVFFVSRALAPRASVGYARCGVSKHLQGVETLKGVRALYFGWKKEHWFWF